MPDHAPRERHAEFRFYEELNDFLAPERRKRSFRYRFQGTPAVKDVVEAIGVPHSAVDLILVDGNSVGFDEKLSGGERVAVYPVFERLDISPLNHLRPEPLRVTRFIADVHLGKLARLLRMLGIDVVVDPDLDDSGIVRFAREERRIILTRDVGLLKRGDVTHGYWLRSTDPERQLREVVEALDLLGSTEPFTRCLVCNQPLIEVKKADVLDQLPPRVAEAFSDFKQCPGCGRIYWRGSHYERMQRLIESL